MVLKLTKSKIKDTLITYDDIQQLINDGFIVNNNIMDGNDDRCKCRIDFTFETRMLSLNEIYGSEGVYGKGKLRNELQYNIKRNENVNIQRVRGCKVKIKFKYLIPSNKRLYDIANYAGMNKMIEDALVDLEVLSNDDYRYVYSHSVDAIKSDKVTEPTVIVSLYIDENTLNETYDNFNYVLGLSCDDLLKYRLEIKDKKDKDCNIREENRLKSIERANKRKKEKKKK